MSVVETRRGEEVTQQQVEEKVRTVTALTGNAQAIHLQQRDSSSWSVRARLRWYLQVGGGTRREHVSK